MPLKKIKKHAKHAPRSRRTACTHTQHWHHGNTNNSNINFSSLTAPSSMAATTSKPMYYGYPNDQIWQYIVMKYIHGLMNGQVDLNKQKPEVIKKDKSVENIATKSPKEKKIACKGDNSSNFLKYINVSTETSSSSTTDLSSPDIPTNVQLPLQQKKMHNEREKSSSDSSNKNLIKNKSRSPPLTSLGIQMSAELHQVGSVKAKHDSGDAASDDDSDDDESSDENAADSNREPSWQTVLQMMQQFGMMSSLCAGGSRGPLPF